MAGNYPTIPNYTPGVGRLVTDRYDFEAHILGVPSPQGFNFRHQANQIDVVPNLTIDGYTSSDVQTTLANIAGILNNEHIPFASGTTPGLIQLSGDIATTLWSTSTYNNVTVGHIQGYPITMATPPTSGNVLGWNGTAWVPTTLAFSSYGGDLSGTPTSQTVISLTGNSSTVGVNASNLVWSASATPRLLQTTASGSATNFTINAQNAGGTNTNGGSLFLVSGTPGAGGLYGNVNLQVGAGNTLLQAASITTNQVLLSLVNGTNVTTTDVPINAGSFVMYVSDTNFPPSLPPAASNVPVNGSIWYSYGGQQNITQSSGDFITVGNPNLKITNLTPDNLTSSTVNTTVANVNTTFYRYTAKLKSLSSPVGFNIACPSGTSGVVKATFLGQELNNYAVYKVNVIYNSFIIDNLGNVTLGTPSTVFSFTSGGSWASPGINAAAGGLISLGTGFVSGGDSIWTVDVEITMNTGIQV